jgi:hypothetical protein
MTNDESEQERRMCARTWGVLERARDQRGGRREEGGARTEERSVAGSRRQKSSKQSRPRRTRGEEYRAVEDRLVQGR